MSRVALHESSRPVPWSSRPVCRQRRREGRSRTFLPLLVAVLITLPGPARASTAGAGEHATSPVVAPVEARVPVGLHRGAEEPTAADTEIPPVTWPTTAEIIREFNPPWPDWLPGHRGLDLAAGPGRRVRSPRDGVIAWRGRAGGVPVLVVGHGLARATYQPVVSELSVGSPVRAGQVIGRQAAGGHCRRTCLHWGLRLGDRYLDPRLLLHRPRPVLVPVEGGAAP